jgi:autotransporter-associated beta strand protein
MDAFCLLEIRITLEKIMKAVFRLATMLAIVACYVQCANADTFYNNLASGTDEWRAAGTWQPDPGNTGGGTFPNADADVAVFQTSSINGTPLQTANRTVEINNDINTPFAATIGRLDFNLDISGNLSRNVINQGDGDGTLIFDGPGSTNAQLNVTNVQFVTPANLVGLNDINAPVQLNDQLQLTINSTSGRNDHLNLRMRGLVTGSGGITKLGPANTLLIWPTPNTGGGLQYTGPTYLGDPGGVVGGTYGVGGGGRNQFVPTSPNGPSTPTASSAFYVVGNAQLGMSNDGTFQFGAPSAVLHFNSDGTGNSGGQGALRPERTATRPTQVTITNTTVSLDGPNTIVHSEGQAANGSDPSLGYIQFNGVIIGGPTNKLQLTTTLHSANKGTYVLAGANTFSGGIDLHGGRLSTDFLTDGGVFNSATVTTHPNATFGTGDIHVFETSSSVALSESRLTIPSGVINAIGDNAMLSIDGLNDTGFRSAFAELGAGVNELVGSLVLGGILQTAAGTYGSTSSAAMFQFDEFFTGTGVITIPAAGQEGDHNGDGIVDAADYVVWRKGLDPSGGAPAGYDEFYENFGEGGPGAGGTDGVPEPGTLFIIGLLITPFAMSRRRRRM